jgi:hypothetical protein
MTENGVLIPARRVAEPLGWVPVAPDSTSSGFNDGRRSSPQPLKIKRYFQPQDSHKTLCRD